MKEKLPQKRDSFDYDDQGVNEVSEQIMNAYNSGVMGQDYARAFADQYPVVEGEME